MTRQDANEAHERAVIGLDDLRDALVEAHEALDEAGVPDQKMEEVFELVERIQMLVKDRDEKQDRIEELELDVEVESRQVRLLKEQREPTEAEISAGAQALLDRDCPGARVDDQTSANKGLLRRVRDQAQRVLRGARGLPMPAVHAPTPDE